MIYECFFESELWQVKTGLKNQKRHRNLLLEIGANALNQAAGISSFNNRFSPVFGKDDAEAVLDLGMDTDSNWLMFHLHDYLITYVGTKPLEKHMRHLAQIAWKETDKAAKACSVLPFLAYYETRWNERKGYGELAVLAKETADGAGAEGDSGNSRAASGSQMAAMVQCYGEMTEEAFDQREVFADLFRSHAESFLEHWNPQALNCGLDDIKAAYALLKGIRLGILRHEGYQDIAKIMLTFMELNGFLCEGGRVRLKEERPRLHTQAWKGEESPRLHTQAWKGEESPRLHTQTWKGEEEKAEEKAMYCMMAYSEYLMLGKERPYYGI